MAYEATRHFVPVLASMAAKIVRRRLGRRVLAERVRWPRRNPDAASNLLGGVYAGGRPADGECAWTGTDRTYDRCVWHGGAEEAIPAEHSQRGRNLVSGIFRTRRRLRLGWTENRSTFG